MHTYEHSVLLTPEKCTGCTTCLRHCPTEAIRIRDGRAVINEGRCIDCGECIRLCPYQAKKATYDKIEDFSSYKYKIALPAPAFFGQFDELDDITLALKTIKNTCADYEYQIEKMIVTRNHPCTINQNINITTLLLHCLVGVLHHFKI